MNDDIISHLCTSGKFTSRNPSAQVSSTKPDLPAIRSEVRARIAAIDDNIASIRTQIATHDLKRQTNHKPIDATWFHRAKTALRHLQRERSELFAHLATLPRPKDALKDQLIAVLRERHDEAGWADVMDEAHRRLDGEAV